MRRSWTKKPATSTTPATQQAPDQAGVQPVEPVALVERGIDQRQPRARRLTRPNKSGAGGAGWRGSGAARRTAGRAAMPSASGIVLPEDPAPGEVVDVPALQRGGDVERELEVQRIEGDAVGPVPRRHAAQDEAQGQRDEEARGEAAGELQRQQHRQAGRERLDERDHREGERRADQHPPRAVDARPARAPAAAISICAMVCAVVIQAPSSKPACMAPRMSARPKVERRAVQGRDEGAEQHGRQAEPGDRLLGRRRGRSSGRGRRRRVGHRRPSRASIEATTDMPGRRRSARPSASSMAILIGDALHHLGEVAGGVVGRQQRELGARAGREGQHMALQRVAGEGVDRDLGASRRPPCG